VVSFRFMKSPEKVEYTTNYSFCALESRKGLF